MHNSGSLRDPPCSAMEAFLVPRGSFGHFDAAKAGDPVALEVFDKYAHYLALAVNNVISFFDPDMIILGGGVSRAGDFLLNGVKDRLPEYLFYPTLKQPELRLASLGNDAGIIGAALLGQ